VCIPVLHELVLAIPSPSTTLMRTENPAWEVKGTVVPIQFLLAHGGLPTCAANELEGWPLEGGDGESMRQVVNVHEVDPLINLLTWAMADPKGSPAALWVMFCSMNPVG
jgi:hypothetical protein